MKMLKKIIPLLIMLLILSSLVYGADTLTQEQQAILDTAKAFFYRGSYIDYDSIGMNYYGDSVYGQDEVYMQRNYLVTQSTHDIPNGLDWLYSPEDATRQYHRYFVCSHFVSNVFYEAFVDSNGNHYLLRDGEGNIARITKKMYRLAVEGDSMYNPEVAVDLIINSGQITEEDKQRVLNELEPGDLIVYSNSNGGHAGIYVGNGLVYESTHSKYNVSEKKDSKDTTVGRRNVETFININLKYLAILRPLNEIKKQGYQISSDTLKRMEYPDLMVEKIASTEQYDSVNPGDQITYSIILTNKSKTEDYSGIKVTDNIPSNTEFVSIDSLGTNKSGALSWNVSVGKEKSVTLKYTVKVKNTDSLNGKTISNSNTIVNGIKINIIQTKVNHTLTKEEQTKISNLASNKGKNYSSTEAFLNEVYPNANFKSVGEMVEMFFTSSKTNITKVKYGEKKNNKTVYQLKKLNSIDSSFANMFVDGLWGGFYTIGQTKETNDDGRGVYFDSKSFMIGDVLILCDEGYQTDIYVAGEKNLYLYLAENKFATVDNGKLRIIEGDEGARLIDSLIAQDAFIVLRPSFTLTSETQQSINYYQVGTEYFSTLEEAGKAVQGEGTIKVLETVEDQSSFTISASQNIVLDTNGKTIYLRKTNITNRGTLTIKGKGRLETDLAYLIQNYGILTVDGPTLVTNGMTKANWYTIFSKGGTVTVLNGNIGAKGTESANTSNGRGIGLKDGAILTVKGGQVKSYIGYAITSISSKTGTCGKKINIEGGAISGMYGVHVSADGNYEVDTKVKMIDGSIETTKNAVDIKENTDCEVIIEGGTLLSKNEVGIAHQGNGKLVIGKNDQTISVNKPEIHGKLASIQSKNGFEFYDGILKGSEKAYDGQIIQMEENSELLEKEENKLKTVSLKIKDETPVPTGSPTPSPTRTVGSFGGGAGGSVGGTSDKPEEYPWQKADNWAIDELIEANQKEIIPKTLKDKDFTMQITRKDFAAVAVELYEAISGKATKTIAKNPFIDTEDEYVLKAYNLGITNGTSKNTFTPDKNITREQMATMLTRALKEVGVDTNFDLSKAKKFSDDDLMHEWGKEAIYFMAKDDIIKGVGNNTFNVLGNAKIEEALLISLRSIQVYQ